MEKPNLFEEAVLLYNEDKYDEAIEKFLSSSISYALIINDRKKYLLCIYYIGLCYFNKNDKTSANIFLQIALETAEIVLSRNDILKGSIFFSLGIAQDHPDKRILLTKEAENLYRINNISKDEMLAQIYLVLGVYPIFNTFSYQNEKSQNQVYNLSFHAGYNVIEYLKITQEAFIALLPNYFDKDIFSNPEISFFDVSNEYLLIQIYLQKLSLIKFLLETSDLGIIKTFGEPFKENFFGGDSQNGYIISYDVISQYISLYIETAKSAVKALEVLRSYNYFEDEDKIHITKKYLPVYESPIIFISKILVNSNKISKDDQEILLSELFRLIQKYKAYILYSRMIENQALGYIQSILSNTELNELKAVIKEISDVKSSIIKNNVIYERNNPSKTIPGLSDYQLDELSTRYKEIIETIEEKYPDYYSLRYSNNTAEISAIQNDLDSKTALAEYIISDNYKEIIIFLITKSKHEVFRQELEGTNQNVFDLVQQYISHIKELNIKSYIDEGKHLYRLLIYPILPDLIGIERLIIIPDKILFAVPFETFIETDSAATSDPYNINEINYLINKYEIMYNFSGTLWKFIRTNPANSSVKPKLIGFAPIFDEETSGWYSQPYIKNRFSGWAKLSRKKAITIGSIKPGNTMLYTIPELEYTEEQLDSISEICSKSKVAVNILYRKQATKENFKNEIYNNKYVHIASHGQYNKDNPNFSLIAFAPPEYLRNLWEKEYEDYENNLTNQNKTVELDYKVFLFSGETFNLRLNADLIVLCGCDTAAGDVVCGEGVMSMTRGFLYSGAKNIISSIWSLNEIEVIPLMLDLYKSIFEGKPYSKALKIAKTNAIKKRMHPFYWAPFILIGS